MKTRHRRDRKGIYILHTVRITNVSFEVQYCENKWWLPGAKIQSLITSTLRIFAPSSSLVSTGAWKTDTFMAVFLVVNCTTLWPEFIFVLLCLANSLSCQTETQMYSVWKMSKSLYYRCAITLFVLYNNIIPERKTAASLTATLRFVIAPPDIYSPTLELWHRVVFQGRALNRRLMWPHLCDDEGRKSQSVSSPLIWPSVSESLDRWCVSERRLLLFP